MSARAHLVVPSRILPTAAAVALLALAAGCASNLGGDWTAARSAEAHQQGLSEARLARIAPAMKQQIDTGMFPGAVTLVARNGKVVHYEAHGHLDEARTRPMQKDSLFRLASMTKPIVTTAAMMLVEQGKMKINDPVVTWLPELKDLKVETASGDVALARPLQVIDLMRHTSGLVYAGSTRSPRIKKMYEDLSIEAREVDITTEQMLQNLGRIPLAHQPGTFWEYSISTDVLGLLLERVEKKPLDAILKEMLFDPLGMKETTWWVPAAQSHRMAEALNADPLKAGMLKGYRQSYDPKGKSYFKGGAGLVSTAPDYLRYAQMMVNGGELDGRRYLSRKTVEFMLSQHTVGMGGSPIASTGPGYGFGIGFGVRQDEGMGWTPGSKGDAMWAGAWGTSFWIDPKEKLVGILMAQGPSTRGHTRMLYKNLVYGALVN
ncbi:MAG TPA: serine hydrolase domain-containing protein [Ramlibacter sp.]|jgi:CubicO group peptidase (beta-lactamase class C family)|nr:serine hydrolase domain-containing protein [Ramlibacter sp.]